MKFQSEDKKYFQNRKKISSNMGPRELWNIIDHWPLYVGISNLARFLSISDLLKQTLNIPGHIAEFGSWRGANLLFLAKILKIYDPNSSKVVHCFESFKGLKTFAKQDGKINNKNHGAYRGNYRELQEMLSLYSLKEDVVIHQGNILRTLPTALRNRSLSFSFVYCDTDLYEPTKLILDSLHPRMVKGGIFCLDEWNFEQWPGESVAVREFMKKNGRAYQMIHIQGTRQPSLVLRKVLG